MWANVIERRLFWVYTLKQNITQIEINKTEQNKIQKKKKYKLCNYYDIRDRFY